MSRTLLFIIMNSDTRIAMWLDEDMNESDGVSENEEVSEDSEPDNLEQDDHDSASEQSAEEDNGVQPQQTGPQYTGRDNVTMWNIHPPNQQRDAYKEILSFICLV